MVASSLETVMLASIFVMKKKRLLFLSCFSEKYRDKTPYHGHDNANHLFEYLYDDYVKQKHTWWACLVSDLITNFLKQLCDTYNAIYKLPPRLYLNGFSSFII